jgi:2-phosphosulfolactate phosphatase
MNRVVGVDCFHTHLSDETYGWTIVAVDVIRAATTAITAVETGQRCFPVPSIEAAVPLAGRLENPVLAGELGGLKPYGFDLQNSPTEVAERDDISRPLILLATSGTRLMCEAAMRGAAHIACLRNAHAAAKCLAEGHEAVMLLAAASRGEFREEDQLCCARIARILLERGYEARDPETEEIVARWGDASDDAFVGGHSSEYLRRTGQEHDLEFVISHIDDLETGYELRDGEVVRIGE